MAVPAVIGALGRVASVGGRATGRVAGGLGQIGNVVQGIKDSVPQLEDEAIVEVVGQPGANKRELYYLAMAAACGLVRRYDFLQGIFPPIGMVMIEYDAADNWVRARVRYKTSLLSAVANNAAQAFNPSGSPLLGPLLQKAMDYLNGSSTGSGNNPEKLRGYAEAPIFSGPAPILVGRNWNFTGALGVGLPSSGKSIGTPKLPFAGKTILTTATLTVDPDPLASGSQVIEAQNPHPPGDFRSRGAVVRGAAFEGIGSGGQNQTLPETWSGNLVTDLLVPLVYSALSNPGSSDQMTFPNPARSEG